MTIAVRPGHCHHCHGTMVGTEDAWGMRRYCLMCGRERMPEGFVPIALPKEAVRTNHQTKRPCRMCRQLIGDGGMKAHLDKHERENGGTPWLM